MSRTWRVAGINFDHMHMGDLLRLVHAHPRAEIAGICDDAPARMRTAIETFGIPDDRVFDDVEACLDRVRPDLVILCPATARHAEYVEAVAPRGVHVLLEKPFAASVADADRMIAAMARGGGRLAINWPLAWVASHRTAHRLLREGRIGTLREVHYYGGNRGPLHHLADKVEVSDEEVQRQKPASWWYRRATGGGSLLDYLGYGATLGTWYHGGRAPLDVTTVTWAGAGIEVDEHSVTVCRYEAGLSRYETRWGTFTDPWVTQTQPACGFVLVGSDGTIASADYAPVVHVQTRERREVHAIAADGLAFPHDNPVAHFLWAIEHDSEPIGPLQPAICRTGQRIIDAAVRSAAERRAVALE